jgi:hypothetical protein
MVLANPTLKFWQFKTYACGHALHSTALTPFSAQQWRATAEVFGHVDSQICCFVPLAWSRTLDTLLAHNNDATAEVFGHVDSQFCCFVPLAWSCTLHSTALILVCAGVLFENRVPFYHQIFTSQTGCLTPRRCDNTFQVVKAFHVQDVTTRVWRADVFVMFNVTTRLKLVG